MKPLFSIITCSIDPQKYAAFCQNTRTLFADTAEWILVERPASLAQGYQTGLARAKGEYLIFCHDDISLVDPQIPAYLEQDLLALDLVGVAGTSRLVDGHWISAGFPYLHGQILHVKPEGYLYTQFGCGADPPLVTGIQALDGVFFACRRALAESIPFDSQHFDGFHLYDLDFSFSAFIAGYQLGVDQRLGLIHQSGGRYDQNWRKYRLRFERIHRNRLAPGVPALNYWKNKTYNGLDEAEATLCRASQTKRVRFKKHEVRLARGAETWQKTDVHALAKEPCDFVIAEPSTTISLLLQVAAADAVFLIHGNFDPQSYWQLNAHQWTDCQPVAAVPNHLLIQRRSMDAKPTFP
ncbi:MAG: hypothetical protein H6510_12575 [Acidobacteria bacterium]|nr:hypothetical protein [Acidobacteriota bacterium]MCB9398641.1 hypothetical protein [Acidobacteriota bacterium]